MNKNRIIIILFLLVGIIGFASQAQAATLTQITATPSDVTAGNTTIYTIAFNTATTILNTGKITIEFPAGFDVSGASFDSWTGFDGGQTLTVTTQTITITRDGLGTSSIAGAKTIVLGNIINTAVTANNYQITVTTKNAADTTLDGPTGTIYFQIFSSHSETDINGIYYLRDDAQTHYQNRGGSGTGIDIGTLSRTAPISDGYRYCVAWVQFYFDENGTYTQTNQITNIYYHIWWVTNSSQGMLGYNKTGDYGGAINESFTVNTVNSPNKVGYYLYTGKQTFASSQSILGNAIYNFGVIFSGIYPNIISYPNQSSFIIINLPDDATLQSLDSDSDGLTDYDELFPVAPTPPTNPHKADTDNDNWEDKYEIDNNLNPIDPDQAPTLGKWFIKQYDGGTANDYFGWFVSSISDIDGDGKDDVLVGVPYADPGGRTDAGSAYIYSSGIAGTLLKQYDGGAAADYLGYSVSSISDIDGDGKDDVLVGVPSADFSGGLTDAGSAYIYSSGTIGTLLKQYNGRAAADYLGYSVSSISDIDGDGKDDVLVGARYADPGGRTNAGSAYIYSSGTAGTLFKQYDGGAANDNFGYSVSSISDIDGDGKDDVLVGAYGADPGGLSMAGSVYIYSSNTGELIKQYDGGAAGDYFGWFVSSISDINGDGKDDVLVGAYRADPGGRTNAGSAYIYSSGTAGTLFKQYDGGAANDNFGYSVSSISDIDGDGKDDVLVGVPSANSGGLTDAGSAYIYSSGTAGTLLKQYDGGAAGDYFGWSVSSISDIDGDGKDNVLVGARYADPGGRTNAGSAYIYSSTGNIPIQSWSKASSKTNAFDLDDYFIDPNNSTIPARSQTATYTASSADNPIIDVSIDADNNVSFSQPAGWAGTETVVFTATDSTGLSSESNTVTLTVTGINNTYDISGQVIINGGSVVDVTDVVLTLSGAANGTTNPDEDGNYSFERLQGYYNYKVTPSLKNYRFFPTSYSYTPLDSDQTEQNFIEWLDETVSEGAEGGHCFIATACYGTPMASEVRVLSRFRDSYLLTNPVGEGFVKTYYKVSPRVALFIREHPVLKKAVRGALNPLIWMSRKNIK